MDFLGEKYESNFKNYCKLLYQIIRLHWRKIKHRKKYVKGNIQMEHKQGYNKSLTHTIANNKTQKVDFKK